MNRLLIRELHMITEQFDASRTGFGVYSPDAISRQGVATAGVEWRGTRIEPTQLSKPTGGYR